MNRKPRSWVKFPEMALMKGFQDGIRAKSVSTAQIRPGEAFICIVVSIRRSTSVHLDHVEFLAFAIEQKTLTRDKPNHREKDDATRLFRLAIAGCPKLFIEFVAANAELKALGANP